MWELLYLLSQKLIYTSLLHTLHFPKIINVSPLNMHLFWIFVYEKSPYDSLKLELIFYAFKVLILCFNRVIKFHTKALLTLYENSKIFLLYMRTQKLLTTFILKRDLRLFGLEMERFSMVNSEKAYPMF